MARTVRRIRRWSPALAGVLLASLGAACGQGGSGTTGTSSSGSSGSGSGGGGGGPPVLVVVFGAPAGPAKEPASETHAIEGYATALGSNGTIVAAGTTTAAYAMTAMDPLLLPIVGDEPDLPMSTGAIHAVAPVEGGLLVAADTALFFTAGSVLQRSAASSMIQPLGVVDLGSRVADDDGDGKKEPHLTIRTKTTAYEVAGETLTEWKVDGESAAPQVVLGTKERLYLAYGHRVYELDRASKKAYPLVFDVGHVNVAACGTPACDEGAPVYFGTDKGLVERSASGAYTLYPLAEEGQPAVAVDALGIDSLKQRLYALGGTHLLRVRVGELPDAVATVSAPEGPRSLAVDKVGDVWTAEGSTLTKLSLGTPLSFEADVKPIVHTYCADCHATGANGAPKHDYESYETMLKFADAVLMRVQTGTMPPLTYPKKVPKETIQVLAEWNATKAP